MGKAASPARVTPTSAPVRGRTAKIPSGNVAVAVWMCAPRSTAISRSPTPIHRTATDHPSIRSIGASAPAAADGTSLGSTDLVALFVRTIPGKAARLTMGP